MSFKTGTVSRTYDIGSIQTLKAISWIGEGIVKTRYKIADTNNLTSIPFVDTDTDRFTGSVLSSKFEINKSDLDISTGNALVVSGLVDSVGKNLNFLADAYGGEIRTVDSLGENFTVSTLMQLNIPEASTGGRAFIAVKSSDGYGQEILVQKRVSKTSASNTDGFQEVFNGANIEVDGYSYPIITDSSEVRLIEEHRIEEQTIADLIVSETIGRSAFNEFVSTRPIKSLLEAYGDNIVNYNIDSNNTDYLLARDEIDNQINLVNARVETLNYESLSNEWVAADVNYKWTTEIYLEKGIYYYNFIITRTKPSGIPYTLEIQDPQNEKKITNDFGKTYSVLELTVPSLITFTLFTAANKVSVVGSFNDYVPDKNLLQIGTDTSQAIRMLKQTEFYTNNHKDWNRIDIYLDKSSFIDRVRFETEAAEEERQKVLILLDDKPITRDEYFYTSGRDLSDFESLPIPTSITKRTLSEFDQKFDDIPDAYGYIDSNGQVNETLLNQVLAINEDGYGLTTEEKYVNWRYRAVSAFSTDESNSFNTVRTVTEYFKILPTTTQVTLRENPSDIESIQSVRTDHFTGLITSFAVADFDMSNRVITIIPALTRGVYRVTYKTTIYGGKLINNNIIEDARGNRYVYVSGDPVTGAVVLVEDIINIISGERETFQLSHYPNPPYSTIKIETLGTYARKVQVGITVNETTLQLNSYLSKGTYVVFFTSAIGVKRASAFVFANVFNSITLVNTIDETQDIEICFVEVPTVEKLNVISVDNRIVTFNSPSQEAIYKINYKVRDFDPALGDSVWISAEDGYGEWNYIRTGGSELDAFDGYGSDRVKVQKISLLTRYDSLSGNARKHKAFKVYTNKGAVQTFTDFSLRYKEHFEAYLAPYSLSTPQTHTNEFPKVTEYVTVTGADGIWKLPVVLYSQNNRLSVKSEYFTDGETISSENIIYPSEIFAGQNPSIIKVSLPEPYIEPFVNLDGSTITLLDVTYGTEKYFSANIYDVIQARDGYGVFEGKDEVVRVNDDEWHFRRWTEVFPSFVLGKVIYVNGNIIRVEKTEELKATPILANARIRSTILPGSMLITNVNNSNTNYMELTLESAPSTLLLNSGIRIELSAGFKYVTDYILNKRNFSITALNESGFADGTITIRYKTSVQSVSVPYLNFITLPAEDAVFIIGNPVDLNVTDIPDKIRLVDLNQLQLCFFNGENNSVPPKVFVDVNNYGAAQLNPDYPTNNNGDVIVDGYGIIVTYSIDMKGYFLSKNVSASEIVKTVKFTFSAASEQMMLGKMSLLTTYQGSSSICEIVVNGVQQYKSPVATNNVDFDSYTIVVDGTKFAVICKGEIVYDGVISSLTNPYIVLGASPREYDQNIEAKFGLYELRRYMLVPRNLNAIGQYIETEVVVDTYNNEPESKLRELDFIIEYDQPQFPKRPKIVDV